MAIQFSNHEVKLQLKNKLRLSAYLSEQIKKYRPEVKRIQLAYIFCTDAYLIAINRQFLNHDTYTDIITFDLSEKPQQLVGEIYISTERVMENAKKHHAAFEEELHRVIFHGMLHLCGYKDKKKEDKALMIQQENHHIQEWLQAFE